MPKTATFAPIPRGRREDELTIGTADAVNELMIMDVKYGLRNSRVLRAQIFAPAASGLAVAISFMVWGKNSLEVPGDRSGEHLPPPSHSPFYFIAALPSCKRIPGE